MENIKANPILRFSVLLTATIAGLFAVLYFAIPVFVLAPGEKLFPQGVDNLQSEESVLPNGVILLNGVKLDQEETGNQIYFVDTKEPREILAIKTGSPYNAFIEFLDKSKPAEFFVRTITPLSWQQYEAVMIHLFSIETSEFEIITTQGSEQAQNLSWSKDLQLLAYEVPALDEENFSFIRGSVQVYSRERNEIVHTITEASNPRWLNGTDWLLYFKEKGLYGYNLVTREEQQIYGLAGEGILTRHVMFDVSIDGNYLAWTNGVSGELYLFSISKEVIPDITWVARILASRQVEFFWPVFSPDSQYLVVQAIDSAEEPSQRKNPRLEIYDVPELNRQSYITLEGFDFNALFIDDWVDESVRTFESVSDLIVR